MNRVRVTADPALRLLPVTLAGLTLFACSRVPPPPLAQTPKPAKTLTVVTPHNESIRRSFAAGFANWHMQNRGAEARINWVQRGTPQCVEYVRSARSLRSEGTRHEEPDVMFGGGILDHRQLAMEGLSRSVDLGDAAAELPAELHGVPLRDPDGRWFATGLSSFGIVYNERACAARGITPPKTWTDLADPRFFGWVGIADPQTSGSNREALVLILQHQGWNAGWQTVLRILANARALSARSGQVLDNVKSGVLLAGVAVNFDGMALAAESGGAVKYVDPPQATAFTPNAISLLASSRDRPLAEDFIRYVLSEEGQVLWSVSREHRRGFGDTLYHYPILPAMYKKYADKLAVTQNPFRESPGLVYVPERVAVVSAVVQPLVHAACGDNHVPLQQAWQRVIAAGLPTDDLERLTAPPLDESAVMELGTRLVQGAPLEPEQAQGWSAALAERIAAALQAAGP